MARCGSRVAAGVLYTAAMRSVPALTMILAVLVACGAACGLARDGATPDLADIAARRSLVAERIRLEGAGDVAGAAEINARLAGDSMERAMRVHDAWMARRHPKTGLFPQSMTQREFNYRNTAADFFCFELGIALDTQASSVPLLRETLARERALNVHNGLCVCLDWETGAQLARTGHDRMFATSEYLKDGLIGLYDRHGDAAVLARMTELADAIIAASAVQSRFGAIPSRESEINGNVLQTLCRLGFAAGRPDYFEFAGRLGEAVVEQMLEAEGGTGLPLKRFDYPNDRPAVKDGTLVQLRDHGNETAVGVSEVFALAVSLRENSAWNARAERWVEPTARMFETILSRGVNGQGLLVNTLDARTLEPTDAAPCDNWGYLLAGAILFVEAAERQGRLPESRLEAMLASIDRVALAVTKTDGLPWEGMHHDGFADSVESALYVASRRTAVRRALLEWADVQIGYMFKCQRPDGFVSGDYLDGNFIRTAVMYADMRAGGFRLVPWVKGAAVGLAAGESGSVVVVLTGEPGYRGRLVPDFRRDSGRMHLPWDWSRINSWPEWAGADVKDGPPKGMAVELGSRAKRVAPLAELGARVWKLP